MQRMLRPLTRFALALAVLAPAPHAAAQDPSPEAPVVLAAGDIANCKILVGAVATGRLLDQVPSATILTLGDNAYESGTASEFAQCFGPTWGRNKDRIRPVLGNHDIRTKNGGPYFEYFGERAGPKGRGYYSFEIGSWHVIAMNSAIDTGPKSKQLEWLAEDLAAHPSDCILAYWHIPLFSSGPHGPTPQMIRRGRRSLTARADVVLNGHDHDYERFAPQDEFGKARPARDPRVRRGHGRRRRVRVRQDQPQQRGAEQRLLRRDQAHAEAWRLRLGVPARHRHVHRQGDRELHAQALAAVGRPLAPSR